MIFCLHRSPIRFGNQHIAGSQRVLLWYAETPHPVQVQRPWRRWSYHPCKIRPSVWWLTAKSLSFCQCNRHLQWSCGIWLSRPLAKRRWMSVKSGWPTSWSTGVSAGSTTCLRWRDHGSLCSLSLVLSAELHGALGVSSQDYLYGESTKFLSYNDFVNKELVLFSNSDNERSIPCLVDGGSESSAVAKNDSWIWSHALLSVFVCLCVYDRSEAWPQESSVLLLQEEWQAGGEGGPAGWFCGRDVSLSPWRGELMPHFDFFFFFQKLFKEGLFYFDVTFNGCVLFLLASLLLMYIDWKCSDKYAYVRSCKVFIHY